MFPRSATAVRVALDRLVLLLASPDPHDPREIGHHDHAVPRVPRVGGSLNGLDQSVTRLVGAKHFELLLGDQIDRALVRNVAPPRALPAPLALAVADGHTREMRDGVQPIKNSRKHVRLDDRFDFLHRLCSGVSGLPDQCSCFAPDLPNSAFRIKVAVVTMSSPSFSPYRTGTMS